MRYHIHSRIGTIPSSIGLLSSLNTIWWVLNNLSGMLLRMLYLLCTTVTTLGSMPSAMCQMSSLTYLFGIENAELTCSPLCLSSLSYHSVPSTVCVYPQDKGLCAVIAATNINSKSGYSQWSCTTAGYTTTTPCLAPAWPGLSCSGINVVSISIPNIGISGMKFDFLLCFDL